MTPQGLAQLKADEGCELEAYPDPLSGGEPFTIGYGHASSDVYPGMRIDQATADAFFDADVEIAETCIYAALPWAKDLADFRQDVLTNMTFNMGLHRLLGFKLMLSAMQRQDWSAAAAEMLNSAWAVQVHQRANRLADIMENGYT